MVMSQSPCQGVLYLEARIWKLEEGLMNQDFSAHYEDDAQVAPLLVAALEALIQSSASPITRKASQTRPHNVTLAPVWISSYLA